jgi:TAT (twin-arginine translocation) pathway-exported protein
MNRRKFLKWLGVGTAAVVVAPSALKLLEPASVAPAPTIGYTTYIMGKDAVISDWYEYANFSQFAIAADFDAAVQACAEELGHAAGLEISRLHEAVSCGA